MHSLADGKSRQLTDGLSDARYPVFDRDGKYLYFTASTDSGPSLEPDIRSAVRPPTRSIYVVVLSKNDPSPFAPESDEEKIVKPGEERAKPDPPAEESRTPRARNPQSRRRRLPRARVPDVRIDCDKISQRILGDAAAGAQLRRPPGGQGGNLLALEAPAPAPGVPPA